MDGQKKLVEVLKCALDGNYAVRLQHCVQHLFLFNYKEHFMAMFVAIYGIHCECLLKSSGSRWRFVMQTTFSLKVRRLNFMVCS
jgi:hypothetical protein